MWTDIKNSRNLNSGFREMIEQLRRLDELLAQAERDGEGPDLVAAVVAFVGRNFEKVPGLRDLGHVIGLSDRPLDEYGKIAWLGIVNK